jgi:hypothetical protein
MQSLANTKSVVKIVGTGITNGATGTANIDRMGFDYVTVDLILGTADVVSNKPSTLKISESDDTVVTNFANVSGLVGGTDFTIPSANTSNENIYRFNIDCKSRKRYLKVSVTPLTTQAVVVAARLGRPEEAADLNTTKAGVATMASI